MASVKVAVRVRPINKRERDMDCKVIIKMENKKTTIKNPGLESDSKDFSYDHSYWSVDSKDKHFTNQSQVFSDLGMDVIDSAFQGYNACIFAYGQTGAGKSYTMMGCQDAYGLIPRICETMYSRMQSEQEENKNKVEFKTEVSYLEIYNERVRDLLRSTPKKGDAYNLKVREHPKDGPYVQDLSKHIVSKYSDIEKLMDVGNNNRTTASTNMNDTSSRSHAIFTINFTQAKFYTDMPSETVSKMHLVDLAGSERANSTGATGQRLKEGANINKSLVTLGTVISALAEASTNEHNTPRSKKLFIPYRDSVLTWLLKDSLGGNAKTIMIAAISPADVNYAETISTLRYANRAKNIINKPTVNEDANVKLIRELREEIESLRTMLHTVNPELATTESIAQEKNITAKLQKNEAQVEQLYKEWNNKWKETHKIMEEKALAFRREGFGIKMESDLPHLICIDDDILSTGVTLYHLNEGRTHVGKDDAKVKQDIVLRGPGIESEHCILESIECLVTLHPIAEECYVNGKQVVKPLRLSQGAVVLLGKTNMFRFNHPGEAAKLRQKFASVDNLASVVPTKELEKPSYLFYNAGMEMERRYHEEAKDLERRRKELEDKQEQDAKMIEQARFELENLQNERAVAAEEQKRIMEETEKRLEMQRKHLDDLKLEQDQAKENAQRELHELKKRIQQEQEVEKVKFDEEMKKLLQLQEVQQKSVKDKEEMLAKQKAEMEKELVNQREMIEKQRNEVVRLQEEYEVSRQTAANEMDNTRGKDGAENSEESGEARDKADELRSKLETLEAEYDELSKEAHKEIQVAKNNLKKAEMETLQGKVGLMEGKMALQKHWKQLESLQTKHKKKQEEVQCKIREIRGKLEKAEVVEEEELMNQERSILARRQARKKVEEATQKLMEMESKSKKISKTESIAQNKDLLDWQNKEEVQEMQEERKILMELLSKHQVALVKASQLVTETKTKLESHVQNETTVLGPVREQLVTYEREMEPLKKLEEQLERQCQELDKDTKERKKVLYKQRKRINLLEKQHAQNTGQEGLEDEELEDYQREREAELELIHREKAVLHEMEERYRKEQKHAELDIGEKCQDLERKKTELSDKIDDQRKKLSELVAVHDETKEYIEAELNGRKEILKLSKEKVVKDKKELAKLDMKQQKTATKAAEELFMMAEVLEKELAESGKKEELAKIKDHRRKLQELDRQLRLAERKERFTSPAADGMTGADGQQCVIL